MSFNKSERIDFILIVVKRRNFINFIMLVRNFAKDEIILFTSITKIKNYYLDFVLRQIL